MAEWGGELVQQQQQVEVERRGGGARKKGEPGGVEKGIQRCHEKKVE